jgi:hypothetical protein
MFKPKKEKKLRVKVVISKKRDTRLRPGFFSFFIIFPNQFKQLNNLSPKKKK